MQPYRQSSTGVAALVRAVLLLMLCSASTFAQTPPAADLLSDRVGAVAGQFNVNESGNASYQVPISIPPGTAGVQPQVMLSYDSSGGNGSMGPGWSISGLSAISRCKATRESGDFIVGGLAVDGDSLGVNFHPQDRFCLDGQRLFLISSNKSYGDADAEYRLELDPFTRIYSRGGNNSTYVQHTFGTVFYTGPQYFEVQRKDGSISTYGNTVDSRLEANNQRNPQIALVWALDRFEDSSGNYILYEYEENSGIDAAGEQVIKRMRYTGKRQLSGQTTAATAPSAAITFDYFPSALRAEGFVSNSRTTRSRLLKSIDAAGTRFYALNYSSSASGTGESLLTAIKECSNNTESVCYPPTHFRWTDAKIDFVDNVGPVLRGMKGLVSSRMGDVDGDGRLDMVWVDSSAQIPCKNRLEIAFAERLESGPNIGALRFNNGLSGIPICTGFTSTGPGSVDQWWQLIDYNGDGLDDLLLAENPEPTDSPTNPNARWKIHPSRGRFINGQSVGGFDTSVDLLALDGLNIPVLSTRSRMQLADFNGDGLSDMVYAIVTGNGSSERRNYYIRFLERQFEATQFKFSAPYAVDFTAALPNLHPCTNERCPFAELSISPSAKHASRPQDLDGDGRADFHVTFRETLPNRPFIPFVDSETDDATLPVYQVVFRTRERNEALQQVAVEAIYSSFLLPRLGQLPTDVHEIADLNGDGLQDLLIKPNDRYRVCINQGPNEGGFQCETTDLPNMDALQLADVDGNGRADLVYLPAVVGRSQYRYRLAAPNGRSFGVEKTFLAATVNGQDDVDRKTIDFFVDMDGDGLLDYFSIDPSPGDQDQDFRSSTSGIANRFRPRDAITEIENGNGATTVISYLPMTNQDVYRPDRCAVDANNLPITATCTRNKDWDSTTAGVQLAGRGAPVMDAIFPMFVVSHVESDAPTLSNPSARSLLSYRYVGAKLQGGGRGFLGFREIWTLDHNYSGTPAAHVLSRSSYGQRFPFIGMPIGTEKRVLAGAALLSLCRTTDRDKEACRQPYAPGGFSIPASSLVASAETAYASIPAFATAPAPLFLYKSVTRERRFNLPAGTSTGALLSVTQTAESNHDSFGNPKEISTDVHSAEPNPANYEASILRRKRTSNLYNNDSATWRLGRLSSTVVQSSRRSIPGLPLETSIRKASFSYDQSAANTGLLKKEIIEPAAGGVLELLTYYDVDDFGNRIASYTCSADVTEAACRAPQWAGNPMLFQPVNGDALSSSVRRYARTTFDAIGRYPTSSREPFFDPAIATRQWTERTAQTILSRDQWGEVTAAQDINGLDSKATRGVLGRAYWSWTETGASTTSTYRWCVGFNGGTASCPTGASFRLQTLANTGAQSWAYFDRLGRAMAAVSASFNAGVTNQDLTIACTGFDAHGRETVQTQPRFLTGVMVGEPSFAGQAGVCSSAPYKSTTTFDVLARVKQTVAPDGATSSMVYNGLLTTTSAPCNNVGGDQDCNRPFSKEENAAGEVIRATDANGFMVDYSRDPEGNVIGVSRWINGQPIVNSAIYDTRGRKISQTDADSGTKTYSYNAAGELIESTDARGQRIRTDIDARGRAWRVRAQTIQSNGGDTLFRNGFEDSAPSSVGLIEDTWEFDTAANAYGLLAFEKRAQMGTTTVNRTRSYDSLSRVATRTTQLDGRNTIERSIYDSVGRPLKTLYEFDENYPNPSGAPIAYREGSENFYDARGFLRRVCKAPDASAVPSGCPTNMPAQPVYWQISSTDARGNVTADQRHGTAALGSWRGFDAATGRISSLTAGSDNALQSMSYRYDLAGNVVDRTDARKSLIERFKYDKLDRLTESKLDAIAIPTLSLSYDALGNICSKNGNAYTYAGRAGCAGAQGLADKSAHAVTQAFGFAYAYDANGLQTQADGAGSADDRISEYDAFHRLTHTLVGSPLTPSDFRTYFYAPDLSLARQIEYDAAQISRRTHYIGALEWTDRSASGSVNREARLSLPGGLILITRFIAGNAPLTEHRYAFTEPLGSIDVIANESGIAIERMSFDAHGRRRSVLDWQTLLSYGVDVTTRKGFTGHQQLDGAGLIHMNARAFDPRLGRFIQPDPLVEPDATQGWNRYSYVLNNPLTATDPSGMLSRREAIGALRVVGAIVISVYMPGLGSAFAPIANSAAVTAGFTGGLLAGGLQGAISGAFSAAMFIPIGAHFQRAAAGGMSHALQAQKILAHGIAGGVLSTLQGGQFGHGFASAGLTELFAPGIAQIENGAAQTFVAAIVGGTTSELSGGKFANGAVTAAMSYAFAGHAQSKQQARTLSYENALGPEYWPDGSYDWRIKWKLSEPSQEGGWIVQEINFKLEALGADGIPLMQQAHYWEAWRVDRGQITSTSPLWWDDKFGANVRGVATSIHVVTTASARFYENLLLPPTFRPNSVLSAGALPATTINPNLPLQGATQPLLRTFERKWP